MFLVYHWPLALQIWEGGSYIPVNLEIQSWESLFWTIHSRRDERTTRSSFGPLYVDIPPWILAFVYKLRFKLIPVVTKGGNVPLYLLRSSFLLCLSSYCIQLIHLCSWKGLACIRVSSEQKTSLEKFQPVAKMRSKVLRALRSCFFLPLGLHTRPNKKRST